MSEYVGPPVGQPRDDHLGLLARMLLVSSSFDDFLDDLVRYAQTQTGHSCSVTIGQQQRSAYTVAATDDITRQLDERQYGEGRGPCLEALSTGQTVVVADMTTETRWPPYPRLAADLGARSSISHPLFSGGKTIGALNMYATAPMTPDDELLARSEKLADHVAGAVALGLRIAEQRDQNAHLRTALESRTTIDQAIGILIAQQHCTVEEAFALLRQASQGRNVKLREVAAQIVASAQRRSPGSRRGRY